MRLHQQEKRGGILKKAGKCGGGGGGGGAKRPRWALRFKPQEFYQPISQIAEKQAVRVARKGFEFVTLLLTDANAAEVRYCRSLFGGNRSRLGPIEREHQ